MKVLYGKNDMVLDMVSSIYKSNPGGRLGPLFIGVVFDFFFVGILSTQVYSYFRSFPRDSPWIKWLVSIATALSVLKSVQTFSIVWDKNIIGFGDWKNAADFPWTLWIDPPAATTLAFSAQIFFVWRCFELMHRNWWILGALLSLLLNVIGLSVAVSVKYKYDPFYLDAIRLLNIPMLISGVAVDVVITTIVMWKLYRSRRGFSEHTDGILTRAIAITWESALPPAISAILNLILYSTMATSNSWFTVFHLLTPRLYVFSLMHTLNSRTRLSSSAGVSQDLPSGEGYNDQTNRGNTFALSSTNKGRAQTMSNPGALTVRVHRETVVYPPSEEIQSHSFPYNGHINGPNPSRKSLNTSDEESLASCEKEEK